MLKNIIQKDISQIGFFESSLINKEWKVPAIAFGPTGNPHAIDEFVDIKSVKQTTQIFTQTIKEII
jgi:acetylornithine deacetylase/succinyl-diaminopimelate desuccinylase-like protein